MPSVLSLSTNARSLLTPLGWPEGEAVRKVFYWVRNATTGLSQEVDVQRLVFDMCCSIERGVYKVSCKSCNEPCVDNLRLNFVKVSTHPLPPMPRRMTVLDVSIWVIVYMHDEPALIAEEAMPVPMTLDLCP